MSAAAHSPPIRCSLAIDLAREVARASHRLILTQIGSATIFEGSADHEQLCSGAGARLMATYPTSRVSESVASTNARS